MMSQDTGTAMTLNGYRGFTRQPSHRRNRPVRGAASTHDEKAMNAGHGPHRRARKGSSGPNRPTGRWPRPTVYARQEQDSKAKTAAKRRPSRRARFSAPTRAYLPSVPDPPGYKPHSLPRRVRRVRAYLTTGQGPSSKKRESTVEDLLW